ncbi:hypothetical protein BST45_17005 [Mycobacterium shinjukuense]|nr:hypothetical protein BST45_17005 [Mycobacterium shinjukuense]
MSDERLDCRVDAINDVARRFGKCSVIVKFARRGRSAGTVVGITKAMASANGLTVGPRVPCARFQPAAG